jgi:hypothetical protein
MGKRNQSVVGESSRQLIRVVGPVLAGLRKRDEALTEQLVRALTDLAVNTGKLAGAEPKELHAAALSALASVSEAHALLQLAVDWRYCPWPNVKPVWDALGHTDELLRKLAQPRRRRDKRLKKAA